MKNTTDDFHELRKYIYERADVYCNQKYGDNLPYSFHLKAVERQGMKFLHLLHYEDRPLVIGGMICHDSIEYHRMSYNDVKSACTTFVCLPRVYFLDRIVADIVYCVTDEKGKGRPGRKNEKYYAELRENRLAIFVKLADLAANTLYSKLTGSSMYETYKSEFPHFKLKLYHNKFEEFFNYIENL